MYNLSEEEGGEVSVPLRKKKKVCVEGDLSDSKEVEEEEESEEEQEKKRGELTK